MDATPSYGVVSTPRRIPRAAIIFALLAAIVKFVLPALPLFNGHSVNQVTGICNGGLGQFAQAFSHQVATDCQSANTVNTILTGIAAVLFIVAIIVGIRWARKNGSYTAKA